jgi:Domain of unknown function (DUF4160)
MAGEWLWALHVSISRTDPFFDPFFIHVRRGGGEAVFDLDNGVKLRESQGMKLSDIAKAEAIATEYKQLMIKKWHEPFD